MYGLERKFGEDIDFVRLNVDVRSTFAMREQFGLIQRTRYVLVDENNIVIYRWFGPLNQAAVEFDIETWLES